MKKDLDKNVEYLRQRLGGMNELIIKNIESVVPMAILYILGLNDTTALSKFVISPIKDMSEKVSSLETLCSNTITLGETEIEKDNEKIVSALLKGKGILLVDGFAESIILGIEQYKERSLTEPPTSTILKGPRAGFVENLKTNVACIRKILASPKLRTLNVSVGKHTQTAISIMYIEGIADEEIVELIQKRISKIDIDGIIDSYYVAGFLEEHKNSMFKQIGTSEKPDIVSAKLLEGRVAIVVDGSPMVITLPFIYLEDLQNGDDYYSSHSRTTFLRFLRVFSIFISILTPALYIAIVLHHYKAIPLKFLITIVNTTKGLPLTPFAEILFVLILFELLYEASIRMPRYLGLALSIVGALILGDTAVKAGLISPPAVMIVAISGLTVYCVPEEAPQLHTLRFLFTLAGGMLGFFGITALLIFVIAYLCDFDSYKSAYLAPLAPFVKEDMKDAFYKTDIVNIYTRPKSISNNSKNKYRQGGRK